MLLFIKTTKIFAMKSVGIALSALMPLPHLAHPRHANHSVVLVYSHLNLACRADRTLIANCGSKFQIRVSAPRIILARGNRSWSTLGLARTSPLDRGYHG